ncbi:hypothetical protein CANARDRAFT_29207 [[Candida] arabinofermentans NRRL YB-2248]|uniref:Pre-rRNA-processing protein TSR2 n=1 Tax=[Candida] arabinofermentans NRRL YB-2248 TaxID=983967 RepID=A0A1E4SXW9_9ASCO|nr:hypothetical protein CANARDRAFT_29207 [[Candida] arabinofermentans NRRL YB-2248]
MEIVLEDSGYISAQPPQTTLLIPNEQAQSTFELGVSMLIHRWDTLTTAVDNLWGGPQSSDKRDWISAIVIELFTTSKDLDIIMIHELLFNSMEDEFDVLVQDDSTVIVAQNIIEVYKECCEGKFARVHSMYQRWTEKEEYRQRTGLKKTVQVLEDPNNPDESDDDEEDEDEDDGMDVDMADDSTTYTSNKTEPIVDDDGFTMVTKKKGRR